jgi:mannose-6-phosphate isomerase
VRPVPLYAGPGYADRCLAACRYFVLRELVFEQQEQKTGSGTLPPDSKTGYMKNETRQSCIVLTSLGGRMRIRYGESFEYSETLMRGQTLVLPAALGQYCLEGQGRVLHAYVPSPGDEAWEMWMAENGNL